MAPVGYHVRMRLSDNRVILHSRDQQRILSRVVVHQGRNDGLLAFSLPDTHLHLEVLCAEIAANRLCQRIGSSLQQRLSLSTPFVTYPHEPIRDQRHLNNTFHYILTQHERHGLDAAEIREATNLPDLAGLRTLGAYTRDNMRRHLPRVRDDMLLAWGALTNIRPVSGPPDALVQATLAATALPNLAGRAPAVVEARCTLLEVLGDQLQRTDAARLLGISERHVYRIRRRPAEPALVHAIRLQLGALRL